MSNGNNQQRTEVVKFDFRHFDVANMTMSYVDDVCVEVKLNSVRRGQEFSRTFVVGDVVRASVDDEETGVISEFRENGVLIRAQYGQATKLNSYNSFFLRNYE